MQENRTGRESAVDKIRKLLALANDPGATEAERLLAAERAQDFMLRHNIAELELEQSTGDRPEFVEDRGDVIEGQANFWQGDLAYSIGRAVGDVEGFYVPISRTKRRQVLFGRADSIAFVRELVDYLTPFLQIECDAALIKAKAEAPRTWPCDECDGEGEVYVPDHSMDFRGAYRRCPDCGGKGYLDNQVNTRRFRSSFYDAATTRIRNRLYAQRRDLEAQIVAQQGSSGTGMELVRRDRNALKEAFRDANPDLVSSRSSRGGDIGGATAGSAAGARADLSPGSKLPGGRREIGCGR